MHENVEISWQHLFSLIPAMRLLLLSGHLSLLFKMTNICMINKINKYYEYKKCKISRTSPCTPSNASSQMHTHIYIPTLPKLFCNESDKNEKNMA